jgi:uncharacterized protein YjbI with pentapeptide repeats
MKWILGLTLVLASALSGQAADPAQPGLKPQFNKTPAVQTHSDQLKTGIIKTAPSPTQITETPSPTLKVPEVKAAPGVTAPVPTKQDITAPLGQKAAIAVKSPAQGTQHPAGKPLAIIWDKSAIATAATVNILLVDKPGGTAKATIKAGAPNTGSFTSWIAPQQYTAAGNSWAVRIETADNKASGYSGTFTFIQQPVAGTGVVPSVKSGVAVQQPAIAAGATNLAVTKNATSKSPLAVQTPGIAATKGNLAATPQTSALSQDQGSATPLLNELKLGKRKDFSRVSLAGLSLRELDLSGYNFAGADLSGSDMSWAKLDGADLSGTNLSNTKLEGADLSKARLNNAVLLAGANFSGANLSYANLQGCDFTRANLRNANLYRANCEGVSFKMADLSSADLRGAKLKRCDFTKANLSKTLLHGAGCLETNFTEANMIESHLGGTYLNNSIFYLTNLESSRIQFSSASDSIDVSIMDAKLNKSEIKGYQIIDKNVSNVEMYWAMIMDCSFKNINFNNSNMSKIVVMDSEFINCDLTKANLDNITILKNCDFSGSKIKIKYIGLFQNKVINFDKLLWQN